MSINIVLMTNNSENNAITKNLNTITTLSGNIKESTSIIDPVIKIQASLDTMANCNYMYIPTFKRYYFINNIVSVTDDIVEVSAHVDVLMSFSSEIKSNRAIIRRQTNKWNLYLDDGSFRVYQNPTIITKAFPSGFNAQEFVLAVAGS